MPLASAVTANGPGGAAGWYAFPGLAPGSYFVCIAPPPTYILTAPNVGGLGGLTAIQLPRRSEGTAPTFIGDGPDCRRRCHPAAAIIAALSVHIARDGR